MASLILLFYWFLLSVSDRCMLPCRDHSLVFWAGVLPDHCLTILLTIFMGRCCEVVELSPFLQYILWYIACRLRLSSSTPGLTSDGDIWFGFLSYSRAVDKLIYWWVHGSTNWLWWLLYVYFSPPFIAIYFKSRDASIST